jgi:SAM-dependent methyltransferase
LCSAFCWSSVFFSIGTSAASAGFRAAWERSDATPDFSEFDTRGYRTVDVRSGYAEWLPTYEDTVQDAMDLALLEELSTVPWPSVRTAADLGCGTGRTGAWLRVHRIEVIDGVDMTPEMLPAARERGVYRRLVEADVASTGLQTSGYDLVIGCLVDEHLPDVPPLYREAHRLAKRGGIFVLVGYHPHFIMSFGVPTHFDSASGEPVAIETHVHLLSDHVTAALEAGWTLAEMRERVIDESWLELKPRWKRYRGHPVSFAFVWRATETSDR